MRFYFYINFAFLFFCTSSFADEYRHTIIIKPGAYSINTSNQTTTQRNGPTRCLLTSYLCSTPTTPVNIDIDTSSSKVFSVEYEWHLKYGMTVGGETFNFNNSYTSSTYNNASGRIETTAFIGNFKKYFGTNNNFQPFLGVGFGYALAQFSGPIEDDAGGLIWQLKAGSIYKIGRYAIYAEYHYSKANSIDGSDHPDSEGGISGSVDLTGDGYFLGLAVSF